MARSRPVSKFKSYSNQALASLLAAYVSVLGDSTVFSAPPVAAVTINAQLLNFRNLIGPCSDQFTGSGIVNYMAVASAVAVLEASLLNNEGYVWQAYIQNTEVTLQPSRLIYLQDLLLPTTLRWKKVKGFDWA